MRILVLLLALLMLSVPAKALDIDDVSEILSGDIVETDEKDKEKESSETESSALDLEEWRNNNQPMDIPVVDPGSVPFDTYNLAQPLN